MMAFDSICGNKKVKDEFELIKKFYDHREELSSRGLTVPRSLLLYGPKNLGKKFMAETFAEEFGRPYFILRPVANYDEPVKQLVAFLDENDPDDPAPPKECLLIVEDIDAIASSRDSGAIAALETFVTMNFSEMNLFLLATATDRSDIPDSILRDHILERAVHVKAPGSREIAALLHTILEKKNIALGISEEDATALFFRSGYSEIESVIDRAAAKAFLSSPSSERIMIPEEQLMESVLQNEFGTPFILHEGKRLEETACHEAGHLIVGEVLKPGFAGSASIMAEEEAEGILGYVCPSLKLNMDPVSSSAIYLGGKTAEELRYHRGSEGASSDIEKAFTELKFAVMIDGYRDISLASMCPQDVLSEDLKEKQERAVYGMLEEAHEKAKLILTENAEAHAAVTEALLQKGWLLRSDIERILREHPLKAHAGTSC